MFGLNDLNRIWNDNFFFIFYEFMEGFECCYYVDLKWYLHLIISNQNKFFNIFKNEII